MEVNEGGVGEESRDCQVVAQSCGLKKYCKSAAQISYPCRAVTGLYRGDLYRETFETSMLFSCRCCLFVSLQSCLRARKKINCALSHVWLGAPAKRTPCKSWQQVCDAPKRTTWSFYCRITVM